VQSAIVTTAFEISGVTPWDRPRVNARNINRNQALLSRGWREPSSKSRLTMATHEHRRIVETPTEARQGEPGPSVLALLAVSTGLAILILGVVWFVFFRT
jgi:hypothetical protein